MESRKVFKIRESYAVFLPKPWCEKNSLSEGGQVEMLWEEDAVVVRPRRPRPFAIRLSRPDADAVAKLLMSAFVTGYDEVKLEVKGMGLEFRHRVMSFARGLNMLPMEEGPEYVVFKIEDVKFDKEMLIRRMIATLQFMLDHLSTAPKADPALLESVDDEIDRYRHMIERLCYKYPTSPCVRHVQLARYIERAADHVVELARQGPPKELIYLLRSAVDDFAKGAASGDAAAAFAFMGGISKARLVVQQIAESEVAMLHADRVLDYLANAAEIYLDVAASKAPSIEI